MADIPVFLLTTQNEGISTKRTSEIDCCTMLFTEFCIRFLIKHLYLILFLAETARGHIGRLIILEKWPIGRVKITWQLVGF